MSLSKPAFDRLTVLYKRLRLTVLRQADTSNLISKVSSSPFFTEFFVVIAFGIAFRNGKGLKFKALGYSNPLIVKNPDIGLVKDLGKVLFDKFLLPFEVSSILLLAAMVGAVLLAKKEPKKT